MKLNQLENERVKKLEYETNQVRVYITSEMDKELTEVLYLQDGIYSWYRQWGLVAGEFKSHVEKLTELFGFKPNYKKKTWITHAVWGFEWEGNEFLFYKSKEGITIQIGDSFQKDKIVSFLTSLQQTICFGK